MNSKKLKNENLLYLDCFAGLSGNMMIGALMDLAKALKVEEVWEKVEFILVSMGISKDILFREEVLKCGIRATYFNVKEEVGHPHRGLSDVIQIVQSAAISQKVKERSAVAFRALAEAEASIHGCSVEEIHFHEVGAIDAIVDIVVACYLLELLEIDRVFASSVRTGTGLVKCAHGKMPIPAPATAKLLESIPYYLGDEKGEFLTPTGAALLHAFECDYSERPQILWTKLGHGAGTRDASFPNILRVFYGQNFEKDSFDSKKAVNEIAEVAEQAQDEMLELAKSLEKKTAAVGMKVEEMIILETYIDDMTPEALAFLQVECRKLDILDLFSTPVLGKKSRLGQKIEILLFQNIEKEVMEILMCFSHTLGIRRRKDLRYVFARKIESVMTEFGAINGKVSGNNFFPEFEDCAQAALLHRKTIDQIKAAAKVCWSQK